MTADELLKIEQQGAKFVRNLLLFSTCTGQPIISAVWEAVASWRGYLTSIARKRPSEWRVLVADVEFPCEASDYAFFAGAETSLREWEAANVDA